MKRTTILLVLLLAASAAGKAESVFDGDFGAAPRLDLGSPAPAFGAEAVARGLALAGEDAPTLGTAAWSLLVPGLAQQKLGRTVRAKIYYGLETLSWIAAGSFLYAGYTREQAYQDYAVVFAGVAGTDRPDEYWQAIGEYSSSDGPGGYNEMIRRDARDLYYPDVDAMNVYFDDRAYAGDDVWQWRTSGDFRRYGKLRDDSRFAYRYAIYSVFFAAVLRVVSTADAVRLARGDVSAGAGSGPRTSLELARSPQGASLCLVRSF